MLFNLKYLVLFHLGLFHFLTKTETNFETQQHLELKYYILESPTKYFSIFRHC